MRRSDRQLEPHLGALVVDAASPVGGAVVDEVEAPSPTGRVVGLGVVERRSAPSPVGDGHAHALAIDGHPQLDRTRAVRHAVGHHLADQQAGEQVVDISVPGEEGAGRVPGLTDAAGLVGEDFHQLCGHGNLRCGSLTGLPAGPVG
jgi:hypothetical protein